MSRQLRKREEKNQQNIKSTRNYPFYFFTVFIVLILPVFYNPSTLDLTTMPRVFILSLFLLFFSVVFFFSKRYKPEILSILKHKLYFAFALWLIVSVIALAFSTNPIEGLFDIVKVFLTIAIAFFGAMLFSDKNDWLEGLAKIVVLSVIVSSMVGFVQYYLWVLKSAESFLPDGRKVIYRVVGVMAHKNLYSLSLFMMLPFVVYGVATLKRYWKTLAIVALSFMLILIFVLQARSVWVGTMIASALTILLLIIFSQKFSIPKPWRLSLIGVAIIGALVVGGALFFSKADSQNQYIKQLQSITDPKSPQNVHRVNIWKTTVDMIKDRPIIGFGPNNWKLHVGYYFKGRFFLEDQINWQRPHNDFLWVFAEKGIFGILLYLSIFGLAFFYLFRVIVADTKQTNRLMALLLIFGLVGYLTESAFDFPYERIFHQAFLGMIFACSVGLYHNVHPVSGLKMNKLSLLIPLVVVFAFGTYYGYHAVRQEANLQKARTELRIINQVIIPRMETLPANQQKNAQTILQNKWKEVLKYSQNAKFSLKNLDPQANPIDYYIGLAYLNLKDYQMGLNYCLSAHNRHPGSIKTLNSLGAIYYNLKQFDEAERHLLKSMQIFPSHDAFLNLSATYFMQEEYEKAYELLSKAPKDIMSPRLEDNLRSISIMIKQKAKEKEKTTGDQQ